jgi:DNA-binding response OmpR family regulator
MITFNKFKEKPVKKILIVEDESTLRKAIKKKLEKEGFQVFEAANGVQGLDLAQKEKPDLVLLDIVMPVKDGIQMLRELRQDEWGKTVEVIMLTNLSDAKKELESFQQGVAEYLVKSDWKISDLVKKIKNKLL